MLAAARREGRVTARLGIVSMTGGPWLSMRGGQIDSLIRLDISLDRWSEVPAISALACIPCRSPAEAAGVLQGDIVTDWNGEAVAGARDVLRRLGPDSEGQTIELSLLRGGQPSTAKCVIGTRSQV